MTKTVLTNAFENVHYSEEKQQLQVKMALVASTLPNEYKTLHNFVNCRDFLSDAIYWKAQNTPNKRVYGFSISERDMLDIQPLLAIETDSKHIDTLYQNMHRYAMYHIQGYISLDKEHCILILDSRAIANPVNMSFITLYIKYLCVADAGNPVIEELKKLPAKEQRYIKTIGVSTFQRLINSPSTILPANPLQWTQDAEEVVKNMGPEHIHDYLGIVSMFVSYSPNSNLKQYFQELKKQTEANERISAKANRNRHSTSNTSSFLLKKAAFDLNQVAEDLLFNVDHAIPAEGQPEPPAPLQQNIEQQW